MTSIRDGVSFGQQCVACSASLNNTFLASGLLSCKQPRKSNCDEMLWQRLAALSMATYTRTLILCIVPCPQSASVAAGCFEVIPQNCNYAVDPITLLEGVEVTHINVNDGTCAGMMHSAK